MRVLLLVNRGLMASSLNIHGGVWAQTPFLDSLAAESLVGRFHFSETPYDEEVRKIWSQGLKEWPAGSIHRFYIGERPETLPHWPGVKEPAALPPGRWRSPIQKAIQSAKSAQPIVIIVETDFLLPPWEEAALSLADPGPALDESEELPDVEAELEPLDSASSDDMGDIGSFEQNSEEDSRGHEDDQELEEEEGEEEFEEDEEEEAPAAPEPVAPVEFKLGPIDPEGADARRLQVGRALMLAAWDEEIESFYGMVDKSWAGSPWAMIVTSDTGFPLGEAGQVGQDEQRPLHQESLRIPLIIHAPGLEPGMALRELSDHGGLADWLAKARTWENRENPLPPFEGKPTHIARQGKGPNNWSALRTLDATLIAKTAHAEPSVDELKWYEQPEDLFEFNDLAQREPERVAERYQVLREMLNPEANLNPEAKTGDGPP